MNARVEPQMIYDLIIDGRSLGRFPLEKLIALRAAIDLTLSAGPIMKASPEIVLLVVGSVCNMKREELLSKSDRHQPRAWYRQIAMSLCREYCAMSLQAVGDLFGGRDHGTVIHAEHTVANRSKTDWEDGKLVKSIRDAIKQAIGESASPSRNGNSSLDAERLGLEKPSA